MAPFARLQPFIVMDLDVCFARAPFADARALRGIVAEVVLVAAVCEEFDRNKTNNVPDEVVVSVARRAGGLGDVCRYMAAGSGG